MNSKSAAKCIAYGHLIFTLIIFQLGFFRYQISGRSWITTEAVIVDEEEYTFKGTYGATWGIVKQAFVKYEVNGQLYHSDVLMSYKDEVGDVIQIAVKKRDYEDAMRHEFLPLSNTVVMLNTVSVIYLLIDMIYSIIKKRTSEDKESIIDVQEEKQNSEKIKAKMKFSADSQLLKVPLTEGGSRIYECYENGLLKIQIDSRGNTTTYVYDETGIITATTNSDDNAVTVTYDSYGNMQSVTDSEGSTINLYYNESGEIASTIDFNGNKTTYAYEHKEKCITCTDSVGNVMQYYYDVMGQIVSVVKKKETEDTVISYMYDAFGNIISLTDGVGVPVTLYYGLASSAIEGHGICWEIKNESIV